MTPDDRKRKFLQLGILLLLPILLTAVRPNPQLSVIQSEADYEFGQALHFSLKVESEAPVTAVTLYYRSADNPVTTTVELPIEPDTEIEAVYTANLTDFRLTPFTTVTYWWQIEDSAGNTDEVPSQSFAYEDDRFQWQELLSDTIIVRWAADEPALGQTAFDILNDTLPRLAAVLPLNLPDPLRIYIYPSAADLQASLRLAGRDWVGGHTNPELGVVLVTASNPRTAAADLHQSIPHELAHIALYQAIGTAYESIPAWFNEGLSALMEANVDSNEQLLLDEALANGTTISFSELCLQFPVDGRLASLAYAQSGSLVRYIQTHYGNSKLNEMVLALADGADCETVTTRTLGVSLSELEQDWLHSNNSVSSTTSQLHNNFIWLLLLLGGFVLMGLLVWPVRRSTTGSNK